MNTMTSKIAKAWAGLRTAHEAVMVDDAQQTLRTDRAVTKAHHRRTFGQDFDPGEDGGDMIHVGDYIVNNTPPPAHAVPATTQPAPAKGMGTLAKIGIGAALLGTGIGGGLGLPLIIDALKPEPTPAPVVVQPPTDTDTDSYYELRLGPPE